MELIFQKKNFPQAPGGDRYEWVEAETSFSVVENGQYLLEIAASCKNASQNHSTDDDDLRIALDGYDYDRLAYILEELQKFHVVFANNQLDAAEVRGVLKNFEIEILFKKIITL